MVGGKIGKEMYLNLYSVEESLLNMTPFHSPCVQVGKSTCLLIMLLYKITNRSVIPVVESVFPRQLSCPQYVRNEVQSEKPSIVSAISAVLKPSIVSTIPESVPNHLLLLSTSNLVICFVSLMWDTLRPSCDESFPVDFNSLSRNQTQKLIGTFELACLNGRFPRCRQCVFIIDPRSRDFVECSTSAH